MHVWSRMYQRSHQRWGQVPKGLVTGEARYLQVRPDTHSEVPTLFTIAEARYTQALSQVRPGIHSFHHSWGQVPTGETRYPQQGTHTEPQVRPGTHRPHHRWGQVHTGLTISLQARPSTILICVCYTIYTVVWCVVCCRYPRSNSDTCPLYTSISVHSLCIVCCHFW